MASTVSTDRAAQSLLAAVSEHDAARLLDLEPGHVERGMLNSEILAVYAVCKQLGIRQIIESGRWLGHSTLILSQLFRGTDVRIVSLDLMRSEVAVECERRLKGCDNVKLAYGNAFKLLPGLIARASGPTALLVDGPKGTPAVELIAHCMGLYEGLRVAFLHDSYVGSEARGSVVKRFPGAEFSDDKRYVERFSYLDSPQWRARRARIEYHHTQGDSGEMSSRPGAGTASYGPTLAVMLRTASSANPAQPRAIMRARDEVRFWMGVGEARVRGLARRVRSALTSR